MGIDLTPYLRSVGRGPTAPRRECDPSAAMKARCGSGCGRLIYYKGFLNAGPRLDRSVAGDAADRRRRPRPGRALEAEARAGWAWRSRVRVPGGDAVSEAMVPYYLAADAFWFPSNARSEAFGIVQVEAMASGCPVINTAIPHSGVAWVSRARPIEGLTVPMDDPSALAAAANRMLIRRAGAPRPPGRRRGEAAPARSSTTGSWPAAAWRSTARSYAGKGIARAPAGLSVV